MNRGGKVLFTNDQLEAMIRQEIISDMYPYSTGDEQALKNYLKAILAELKRSNIHCKVEIDHFGSGYASYIQWFCYEDAHLEMKQAKATRTEDIRGLYVLISRLAPIIVIGPGDESTTYSLTGDYLSGGKSVLDSPFQLDIETPFHQLYNKLLQLFMKYNYTVLQKEDLEYPLPFDTVIPTLSRKKGQYLMWDAIFYWED